MARKSKVEQYGLEPYVDELLAADPDISDVELARLCSEKAGTEISNMAIKRYLESKRQTEQKIKKEVIVQDRRRLLKTVNQELDIIQLQYSMTAKLAERFDTIDTLPELFKEQFSELKKAVSGSEDPEGLTCTLNAWSKQMDQELKRKIYEITSLNRELRENSKFLAELREKAFEFSLVQEYLFLFMEEFRKESTEAYERAVQRIASNPRMQRIVEQQMQMRGEI